MVGGSGGSGGKMSRQVDKEEAVQRALGTLPSYRVAIYGPHGGIIGRCVSVEAITVQRALYQAYWLLSPSIRKRFLRSHKHSFIKYTDNSCSAYIQLDDDDAHSQMIGDLRIVLDYYGNIREDIPKEMLHRLKCIQKGEDYIDQ